MPSCCACRRCCGVVSLGAAAVAVAVAVVSRHIALHGSLYVADPAGYAWPGDFPRLRSLDILQRPDCLRALLSRPGSRLRQMGGCPEASAGGGAGLLDLRAPFLLHWALRHWNQRWARALLVLRDLAGNLDVELFDRPVEQHSTARSLVTMPLREYARGLHEWPSNVTPVRPLYLAEVHLATWDNSPGKGKLVNCPIFTGMKGESAACNKLSGFLFQDFGWVLPALGSDIQEVEAHFWAGPAGSRTGLHADIDPYNLLAVLKGQKRITLWPPALRSQMHISGRFDGSASLSEIDVFDPSADERFPDFAAIRHHNFSFVMSAGDLLHIPPGWWHVAENYETSLAVTFHVYRNTWEEYLKWLPHRAVQALHNLGLYKHGLCTCHAPRMKRLTVPFEEAVGGELAAQGCLAGAGGHESCPAAQPAPQERKARNAPADQEGASWVLLHAEKSPFQELAVWRNLAENSTYLMLDGDVQLTSKGEYAYHEMMVYVPLAAATCAGTGTHLTAEEPKMRVFVFGAGDGGVAQRLLRHPGVAQVLQVEIDEAVVKAARRFFPELQPDEEAAQRHTLRIGDAVAFAQEAAKGSLAGAFDLVIMDTTDVLAVSAEASRNPGRELFTSTLYRDLAALLRPGGVLAQNVQSIDHPDEIRRLQSVMGQAFRRVTPFHFATPDYISPYFAFLASDGTVRCPQRRECGRRLLRSLKTPPLRFYSPEVHEAAFVLPADYADLAADEGECAAM
uniref:JmjC domain-containing protein n=2 Tax=Alexandrium monilatum TaxID=311494 RepID=A0A7S4RXW5_9DINO|mmetsp:Transcript_19545/g.61980  ORF Transcript_19545/g.61980 Transcript_19545/m.61980 type:complete len:735 (+) Transcript_19545:101-2305(+)